MTLVETIEDEDEKELFLYEWRVDDGEFSISVVAVARNKHLARNLAETAARKERMYQKFAVALQDVPYAITPIEEGRVIQ